MVKKLLILLVLVMILISGCITKEEIKQTNTQITAEQNNEAKSESNQETKEDINLLAGYNYPINIHYLNVDSSKIVEIGETEGYAIRIFISPATCNGTPLKSGDGCKGEDRSPPIYNFINVNFDLSDEQRGYSTIDGAWENSPRIIGINEDNILIKIKKEDYSWRVSCGINITKDSCSGGFSIFNSTPQSIVKNDLTNELSKLDVIDNISDFEIIVEEGFIRPKSIELKEVSGNSSHE